MLKSSTLKSVSQVTGGNQNSQELGSRVFSSDTKSSPAIVSPHLEDSLRVVVLPLLHKPLIPGSYIAIQVKDPKLLEALEESRNQQAPSVGAFLLKDSSSSSETENHVLEKLQGTELFNRIHRVGTLAKISSIIDDLVFLIGSRRLQILEMVSEDPLTVKVDYIKDKPFDKDDAIKATYFRVTSMLWDDFKITSLPRYQVQTYTEHVGDFSYQNLADFGAMISGADKYETQRILEELDVHKRLELTLELQKKNLLFNGNQEHPKSAKDKSDEDSDDESDKDYEYERFRKRIDSNKDKIPKHVLNVMKEELKKLKVYSSSSSDYSDTIKYLDCLTVLPWGNFSDENYDVLRAEKILDEDYYGLSDVKERILEFIAVGSLTSTSQGKIICLSGPPGVGKTSIARSIARALNREFFQFSVGGLSDADEIKGHCRTYSGAVPGKMVQCLKRVGTENPLVLIDEIDKLGRSYRGDPASALLEVLDPEQNANFLDHYLNVPIDLSKVLFICTANEIDTIAAPLLDRMEVIPIAGYITDEKMHIARDHLLKSTCIKCGIKPEQVDLSDAALLSLIENYCREAGVRNLQKQIEKIYRKIALKVARKRASAEVSAISVNVTDTQDTEPLAKTDLESSDTSAKEDNVLTDDLATTVSTETKIEQNGAAAETFEKVMIDESNLSDYVGKPKFRGERIFEQTPVGVVMGLAWTSMGGSMLYIETTIAGVGEGKGDLRITGQLGDVMKESAEIAHTAATRIMLEKEPDNMFFANSKLHLHVPEGATPKDGPSAGCTMITSLLSLAMKKPVRKDLAMTGEVTLTGRILPIGGVKEKTIGARRSQVKMIIFPEANRSDFHELAENLKEGLDVHFVDKYEQIFELAFGYDH